MPLVTMPCGFDDGGGLVMNTDFDWSSNTSAEAECYDPLFYSKDPHQQDVILAGSKDQQQPSWCRSGSGSSSPSGGNKLSSSSYCRRLGSAGSGLGSASSRRSSGSSSGSQGNAGNGGATFQLWSPRLRQRDERKRVLKLSVAKLRRIDDAESCLRRSVLLNNTLRRLQREARDEKNPQYTSSSSSNAFHQRLLDDATSGSTSSLLLTDLDDPIESTCSRLFQEVDDNNDNPSSSSKLKRRRSSSSSGSESSSSSDTSSLSLLLSSEGLSLSELYLPPPITPRMISSLDDNSEDESSSTSGGSKRSKSDAVDVIRRPALRPCNSLTMTSPASQASSSSSGLSLLGQQQTTSAAAVAANSNYSCGQSSSLFGELQSVVFHSLITSLES